MLLPYHVALRTNILNLPPEFVGTIEYNTAIPGFDDYPAGTQDGDEAYLVAFGFENSGNVDGSYTPPSGWTTVFTGTINPGFPAYTCYAMCKKTVSGSFGSSISHFGSFSFVDSYWGLMFSVRNCTYKLRSVSSASSGMPDAPSRTMSGFKPLSILLGYMVYDGTGQSDPSATAPSGWTLGSSDFQSGADDQCVMLAYREDAPGGALNPAAFGGTDFTSETDGRIAIHLLFN